MKKPSGTCSFFARLVFSPVFSAFVLAAFAVTADAAKMASRVRRRARQIHLLDCGPRSG